MLLSTLTIKKTFLLDFQHLKLSKDRNRKKKKDI